MARMLWSQQAVADSKLQGNSTCLISHEANQNMCPYFMQYGKDISTYIKQKEYVLPLAIMP